MNQYRQNTTGSTSETDAREINGITIIGPDLFATDDQGKSLSPIASIFPEYRALVTGRGIHATQTAAMLEYLREAVHKKEKRDLSIEEECDIYQNAVALVVRNSVVIIRSDPSDMSRIFAADELLQKILPKDHIQFTGMDLAPVRRALRMRGESWRVSPTPRSVEEIGQSIRSSRVYVGTGATYYQSAPTGARFLTFEEFMQIRPLIREAKGEALARLKEIVRLTHLVNDQGARELSFLLPSGRSLDSCELKELILLLEKSMTPADTDVAEMLFDCFARSFADAAGPELMVDGEHHVTWRTTMFCRLYDINEEEVEEWALGLSPEFFLNVRWLPGARLGGEHPVFEPNIQSRTRCFIQHFRQIRPGIVSINVGRTESSQTARDRTGEQRDVYLVVLGLADGHEEIRVVRMLKWDVMHRLKLGIPQQQAIAETVQYRDYVFDRLKAAAALGISIPAFNEIRITEEAPGLGPIPVFFFDRRYVPGMVTDKVPINRYAHRGFIIHLARLLGVAAATSLALGRANPRTGQVFFDDGDEVIQLNEEGLPDQLVIAETTGSFTDWSTPMAQLLPHCLWHLAQHLGKAEGKRIPKEDLAAAIFAFSEGLLHEIGRMQQLLRERSAHLWLLFGGRSLEPGGIRSRWEGILRRLESTDLGELYRLLSESPDLESFR